MIEFSLQGTSHEFHFPFSASTKLIIFRQKFYAHSVLKYLTFFYGNILIIKG